MSVEKLKNTLIVFYSIVSVLFISILCYAYWKGLPFKSKNNIENTTYIIELLIYFKGIILLVISAILSVIGLIRSKLFATVTGDIVLFSVMGYFFFTLILDLSKGLKIEIVDFIFIAISTIISVLTFIGLLRIKKLLFNFRPSYYIISVFISISIITIIYFDFFISK